MPSPEGNREINMRYMLIVFGFLLTGCLSFSKTVPLTERHRPSGLNSRFIFEHLASFEDYRQQIGWCFIVERQTPLLQRQTGWRS